MREGATLRKCNLYMPELTLTSGKKEWAEQDISGFTPELKVPVVAGLKRLKVVGHGKRVSLIRSHRDKGTANAIFRLFILLTIY